MLGSYQIQGMQPMRYSHELQQTQQDFPYSFGHSRPLYLEMAIHATYLELPGLKIRTE